MWLRLRQIALVAEKLEPAVDDLRSVLGIEVCFRDPGVERFGLENALFPIGNQFIEVVAPTQPRHRGRPLPRAPRRRRRLHGDHPVRRPRAAPQARRGARRPHRDSVRDRAFRNMQLHPKDTGGSFFEIDQQLGPDGCAEDGPWEPAGGADWKSAQRLDRVTGITAAEIQSPRSGRDRRALVGDRADPASRGGAAAPPIAARRLGGALRRATDGRGEGLGGIDVRARQSRRDPRRGAPARPRRGNGTGASVRMRINLV